MKFLRAIAAIALAITLVGVEAPPVLAVGLNSSTFVPITPCRLMDTRPGAQVGPRGTPIGAGETYAATVWGTNGNCTIPDTATAVSLNVTFVAPTVGGFVTVYPPDQPWPGTSNLNFTAGQAPAPNGVTSPLSADGKIGFFNASGTVHLIADIVGYYEAAGEPDADIVLGACFAQLRWDLNNCKRATYPTGIGPVGVAFDGTSLWVTNNGDNTVSRINPATGAKNDFPTGTDPSGVAFDGTSIWIANSGANTVSRLNPATGVKTDFAAGDTPRGVAYDGTSVWVTNFEADTVSKFNPASGTKTDFATGADPIAVAYDGTSVWVVNQGDDTVTPFDPVSGAPGTAVGAGDSPRGIAFDGFFLWVTNFIDDSVSRINPTNNTKVDFATGDAPNGIAFDGTSMWVTNTEDDTVSHINPVSGTRIDYPTASLPVGVAFDGSNVWVANNGSGRVMKFVAGRGVLDSNPSGTAESSTFVPITPCRLMDTRPGAQVGPRGTPINPGETYAPLVWGANGNCNIPSSATAVSLNVTFVGPTADGFVAVFPPDKPWPGNSNLNFSAGQAPAPNNVTSPLSADGKLGFLNAFGQVHLLADIVGYYETASSAPGALVFGNCFALLRFDLPGCRLGTFATGDEPGSVAFDGTSVWVTNLAADTVSKINPTTGSKTDYPTGDRPMGVAFDGTSIWVANEGGAAVSKIDPATGARADYPTDNNPRGVAFDGTNIWVSTSEHTVQKINPATGAVINTFPTEDTPWGMAFDGTSLWIAAYNDTSVLRMDPATGLYDEFAAVNGPREVLFDGSSIWVSNSVGNSVSRFDPFSGSMTNFVTGNNPRGLAFDGTSIWVANFGEGTLSKLNPTTASQIKYTVGGSPGGVAFDGGNIWVADESADTLSKVIASGTGQRLSGVASEGATSFVPVTPCRLMDTRPGSTVGPRNTPIAAGETYAATVWGTNGNCTIPATATAVSFNVTFVGPTSGGFVTVYPPDQPWPGTSNLNFSAGQAPAPNGVTSPLSADGKIGFFNAAGTVNLLADIVGYYEPVQPITTRCLWTLRWDLNACEAATIDVGDDPEGIAFDGTHLWIANIAGGTVSKVNPQTGTSVEYPVGTQPYGVAFDGTSVWVTNSGSNTVSKIYPADGSSEEFATGGSPRGIAFDGTSIWIANAVDDSVSKMNPDGSKVDYSVGDIPWGVVFDGSHIFVTNQGDGNVSKVNLEDGTVVDTYNAGSQPYGIAFDGANLWVANVGSDDVSKINPTTGANIDYDVDVDGPTYLAFDGTSMWVASGNSHSIARIDVTTGAFTTMSTIGSHPYGIVFDGENLSYTRFFVDKVQKLVI